MNEKLRHVKDGTVATYRYPSVGFGGYKREDATIYWPFALYGFDGWWHVTHLPSGHLALNDVPKRRAMACITALRKAAIDYSFTKPTGPKWERAKPAMKAIVVRYRAPQPRP